PLDRLRDVLTLSLGVSSVVDAQQPLPVSATDHLSTCVHFSSLWLRYASAARRAESHVLTVVDLPPHLRAIESIRSALDQSRPTERNCRGSTVETVRSVCVRGSNVSLLSGCLSRP